MDKPPSHPILRALLPPPQTPKHQEDRLKALATIFQTLALSAWGLGILTPLITAYTALNLFHAGLSFVLGAMLELCSLTLLAYVPYTIDTKEGS
ncbi:hypothetical protein K2X14_14465 [Acetobacter sp. TBRC 12305]|uniref:hypothetical protein n=1 Tax=Acetobacter garciniae TaxID=2817435 RepID=UPI001C7396BA|nr:hypothetical protein [Acetobacter garciniae]MBX0346039.1 hypothetical protein [Acetobacter garciniae]